MAKVAKMATVAVLATLAFLRAYPLTVDITLRVMKLLTRSVRSTMVRRWLLGSRIGSKPERVVQLFAFLSPQCPNLIVLSPNSLSPGPFFEVAKYSVTQRHRRPPPWKFRTEVLIPPEVPPAELRTQPVTLLKQQRHTTVTTSLSRKVLGELLAFHDHEIANFVQSAIPNPQTSPPHCLPLCSK
jgi:hypothetical protein